MSAQVKILFFASLREEVGVDSLTLQADDTTQLFDALAQQLPAAAVQALQQDNVRIAVNQQLIEGVVRLATGDEVAFLPPVTGG